MNSAIERLTALRVRDVMTPKPICVSSTQEMDAAAAEFERRGISGAPVVDRDGRCIGVLSATDFVRRQVSRNGAADRPPDADRVSLHQSPCVISTTVEETMLNVARIMCRNHVHRVIVLDDSDVPVGVVTSLDVAAALINAIEE